MHLWHVWEEGSEEKRGKEMMREERILTCWTIGSLRYTGECLLFTEAFQVHPFGMFYAKFNQCELMPTTMLTAPPSFEQTLRWLQESDYL